MSLHVLDVLLRRRSGSFVRAARLRGIRPRAAETLEAAAHEVSPADPSLILDSRELFEEAATRAVVGDGGNLELSFGLVDELATSVEALGLARASDVPDPFRRVWVSNGSGQRIRGVVLTCRGGELAVFCPPSEHSIAEVGGLLWLRYRGFHSSVEYDLQLDDPVRLPGALVLHLKRRSGQGNIGRSNVRHETHLQGQLHPLDRDLLEDAAKTAPCLITDMSHGGLALSCPLPLEQGARVRIDVALPDENDSPFTAEAVVRWARESATGTPTAGVAFTTLPRPRAERLERFLRSLPAGENNDAPAQADGAHSQASRDAETPPEDPPKRPDTRPPTRKTPGALAVSDALFSFPDQDFPETDAGSELEAQEEEEPGEEASPLQRLLVERVFGGLSDTAGTISEHELICSPSQTERRRRRVAGAGTIHISFRLAVDHRGTELQGCLLVPLADAISLASAYLMMPDGDLLRNRTLEAPDHQTKLALIELSHLFAGAVDRALRAATNYAARARSLGCQGVRPNVRPAFVFSEGNELLVGRTQARFGTFEAFEMILMLPGFALGQA